MDCGSDQHCGCLVALGRQAVQQVLRDAVSSSRDALSFSDNNGFYGQHAEQLLLNHLVQDAWSASVLGVFAGA